MSETETTDQGEVQPVEGVVDANSIIAPYLEGVPDEVQAVVAEKLEAFRQDADRNANKKIQQQAEQLKSYTALGDAEELEMVAEIWRSLVSDPVDTIEWLADRFEAEQDRNLKAELLNAFGEAVQMTETTQENPEVTTSLSRDDVEKMLLEMREEFENQAAEEAEFEAFAAQTDTWIREAAKSNHIEIDDQDTEIIVRKATTLIEDGVVDNGKDAIDMATEAFANRIRELAKVNSKNLTVAEGGNPVDLPKDFDFNSAKDRKAAAEALLRAAST